MQIEQTELNCNVYSTMADTTIIIKVKGQVAIQYWTGVVAAVKSTYNLMSEVLDHSTNKN
jgi:hypothetical protein